MNIQNNISTNGISSLQLKDAEYLSLTDVAESFGGEQILKDWLSSSNTLEFLVSWEKFNNPGFKFSDFKNAADAGSTGHFTDLLKEWIDRSGAIGLAFRKGNKGEEIFAHKDIAFEFGLWLSPDFKIFLLKEYHRLKAEENLEKSLECNLKEILSKIHIKISGRADKESFIPKPVTVEQIDYLYEGEADILNVAMFGFTAKQWREQNAGKKGCPKDYCTMEQMIILTGLESMDSQLIERGFSQSERLEFLNKHAIKQMSAIVKNI